MTGPHQESHFEPHWRRPAPRARAIARRIYAWRAPAETAPLAVAAALPFALAAALAPALLSLSPTAEIIGPIAEARAIAAGGLSVTEVAHPLYLGLLLLADLFADSPGRIHLLAKAFAAILVALPAAYFASVRLPALAVVLLVAALAAYAAGPFSGPLDISFALFLVTATGLLCLAADEDPGRARIEGALCGLGLIALWLTNPVHSFVGLGALALAPFVGGRNGLVRYLAAALVFCTLAAALELAASGFNMARLALAARFFDGERAFGESAAALGGVAAASGVVILAAAIFGGREAWRGWAIGLAVLAFALFAARLTAANPSPAFLVAAAFAAFSVSSPFYDGVFRAHDRASVSLALAAAALTLFWTGAQIAHNARQIVLQHQAAASAPAEIRAEFGLVQPGGPTIARWIEEGRFSTPEARELFALAPIDQSVMLLEAAARAREFASLGFDVAILTGADAACVIAGKRVCRADGAEAASRAKIVLVPRIDLDPATTAAKGRSEALLYTEFRLAGQSALWEVWVRRGAQLPADLAAKLHAGA